MKIGSKINVKLCNIKLSKVDLETFLGQTFNDKFCLLKGTTVDPFVSCFFLLISHLHFPA